MQEEKTGSVSGPRTLQHVDSLYSLCDVQVCTTNRNPPSLFIFLYLHQLKSVLRCCKMVVVNYSECFCFLPKILCRVDYCSLSMAVSTTNPNNNNSNYYYNLRISYNAF